jgi:hypothetical protein
LILQGWREVVPYSGDLEVKRLFGDPGDASGAEEDVEELIEGALGEQ